MSQFSQKVSNSLCHYKGTFSNKMFQIYLHTTCEEHDLEGLVETFEKRDYGKCIFYRPTNIKQRYYVYASELCEEDILRILNLKAFW